MRVDSSIGDEPARIFCCDEDSERPKTVDARSCRRIDEQHVDLTGSVMFEASVDLRRRFPFHWSACDVGALSHVATNVDDRDPPEHIVGMTISAAVGAVASVLSCGRLDWRDPQRAANDASLRSLSGCRLW